MQRRNLNSVELGFVEYFSEAGKLFGLPKSVGEIYGLVYSSPQPLSMDDLIDRLEISKGSASQGLKVLKSVNALIESAEGRKSYYTANIELKSLIAGVLSGQVKPLMSSTKKTIKQLSSNSSEELDPKLKAFYASRISKLSTWRRRGSFILPLISKVLGRGV